ncbi:MAG: GNAT family N-acetyltransferase [Alphaproteobacteria bacterium]|nr:GNAT family N-acetyltransferase [Alphaproteobacteria bacterium]
MAEDDIIIREAEAADVPHLVTFLIKLDAHVAGVEPELLSLTSVGKQQLTRRIESFIDEPGKLLLVAQTAEGELIGMGNIHIWHFADIWVNPERKGLRSGYIDDIWVEPAYRSAGIARRLLKDLLDYAAEQEINELTLEYALHNPEADAFWEKLGFKPTGVRASGWLSEVRENLAATAKKKPKSGTKTRSKPARSKKGS